MVTISNSSQSSSKGLKTENPQAKWSTMTSPLGLDDPNIAVLLADHASTCKRQNGWRWRLGGMLEAVATSLAPRLVSLAVTSVLLGASAVWLTS